MWSVHNVQRTHNNTFLSLHGVQWKKHVVDHVRLCTTFQPENLWPNCDEFPGTGDYTSLYRCNFLQLVITAWLIWQQPHKTLQTVSATTTNQTKYCYSFHESSSKQLPFYIFPSMYCNSVSVVLTNKCRQLSFESQ